MNGRYWAALAAAGVLLASGFGVAARQAVPAASAPVFVDPCAPADAGTGRAVRRLPAPVRLPGRFGPILSATLTEDVVLLDVGVPLRAGPNPQWLVGLDPDTLAVRWRWRYPAEPGPVTIGMDDDSWVKVVGDVALTVTGVYGRRPVLHAVDLRTGRTRWTERFPAGALPVAVAADRCLIVINAEAGNGTLGLWGMDPATGRVVWQDGPAKELICTVPARPWLLGMSGGHLVRYSLADGTVTAVPALLTGCSPVWFADTRLVDSFTGRWYSVDWARPAITAIGPAPVRIPPDTYPEFLPIGEVVVVDDHDKATVHDRDDGTLLWQEAGSGRGYFTRATGQPDDRLFFRRHSPFTAGKATVSLAAVRARTGQTLWQSPEWPGTDEYPIADPRTGTTLVHVMTTRQITVDQFETTDSHLYALDDTGRPLWDLEGDGFSVAGPWLLAEQGGVVRGFRIS
ncbi:hypothetical protein GCM10010168_63480 [Actinoplanes ianthinogenes]|uniref:Pyrrolo-quinoline quinone repeat domain-containing protein n=1 Tax=Actinoplanes ianthinogenes TaxID=122358 RepID=A0ABM7LJH8_9ACTN|nr:PQQ-binding-like beta-propeller repeat protein [Actinoplanes ianthinogenes]BCJ39404.1 hypothetical protein Aiant_00610 [Actinoplanes ianthinogenes]GGR36364.1 hypothetical protein GCM10010168_63480 [Actinoplanes ianthinogenes]